MHYLVKDKLLGFKCLNCGDGGSIDHLKSYRCDALEAESDPSYIASRKLAETLRAEEDEAGSGDLDIEAELLREQLALEELLLQAEEGELQRLLAEDEAALLEAQILSLEGSAPKNSPKRELDIAELIAEDEDDLREAKALSMKARAQAQASPQHSSKQMILKIPHINTKRSLEDPNAKALNASVEEGAKKPRVEVQSQSQRTAGANKHVVGNVLVCALDASISRCWFMYRYVYTS